MNIFKLTDEQLDKWEVTRTKSRYLYYLKWALIICLLFTIIMVVYNILILNLEFKLTHFATLSGISFLGGLILGVINWNAMEYGYKISRNKD